MIESATRTHGAYKLWVEPRLCYAQSGMYSKAHRRLGCIKPLRNALQQFAWQTTLSEPWARDYYQRKRAEGKSHTVATRALANAWVRIIFAMWINHQCYQTAAFEQAQH